MTESVTADPLLAVLTEPASDLRCAQQPDAPDNHIPVLRQSPGGPPGKRLHAERYPLRTQGIGAARGTPHIVAALIELDNGNTYLKFVMGHTGKDDDLTKPVPKRSEQHRTVAQIPGRLRHRRAPIGLGR